MLSFPLGTCSGVIDVQDLRPWRLLIYGLFSVSVVFFWGFWEVSTLLVRLQEARSTDDMSGSNLNVASLFGEGD
jgi:hypothetical protein